jgi:hypothetical protein
MEYVDPTTYPLSQGTLLLYSNTVLKGVVGGVRMVAPRLEQSLLLGLLRIKRRTKARKISDVTKI